MDEVDGLPFVNMIFFERMKNNFVLMPCFLLNPLDQPQHFQVILCEATKIKYIIKLLKTEREYNNYKIRNGEYYLRSKPILNRVLIVYSF